MIEQIKWLSGPTEYAEKMIDMIREKQAQNLPFSQVKKEIAAMLLPFLSDNQYMRLDNEVEDCSSPCEFIITTYLVLFHPKFTGTMTQYNEWMKILDIVKTLAPDFVGANELKGFSGKIA